MDQGTKVIISTSSSEWCKEDDHSEAENEVMSVGANKNQVLNNTEQRDLLCNSFQVWGIKVF